VGSADGLGVLVVSVDLGVVARFLKSNCSPWLITRQEFPFLRSISNWLCICQARWKRSRAASAMTRSR